jgi:hypothetical protein
VEVSDDENINAVTCYPMLRYFIVCYAMLRYAMLCYAMICYALLCCSVLCYATSLYAELLRSLTHLAPFDQPSVAEQHRCKGVHQAVDIIVQVAHHVVDAEGRCNDAIHYQIFLRCRAGRGRVQKSMK